MFKSVFIFSEMFNRYKPKGYYSLSLALIPTNSDSILFTVCDYLQKTSSVYWYSLTKKPQNSYAKSNPC